MATLKSLSQLRTSFGTPFLSHRWMIEIPRWPAAAQPSNPDITFFVTTSAVPSSNTGEMVQVSLGGYTFNYNGKQDRSGSIDWSFYENTNMEVLKYFFRDYNNKMQQFTDENNITLISSSDNDLLIPIINMNIYDVDAKTRLLQYQLLNCYFKVGTLTPELGQSADAAQPTVTVHYDSFVVKYN